jgi:hypothetical protein
MTMAEATPLSSEPTLPPMIARARINRGYCQAQLHWIDEAKARKLRMTPHEPSGPAARDIIHVASVPTDAGIEPESNPSDIDAFYSLNRRFKTTRWLAAILSSVSEHYGVLKIDIVSQRRTVNVMLPRQIAMYLARMLTTRSLPEIGRQMGNRDHTTVLHAVRKIARMRETDAGLNAEIEQLIDRITGEGR